MPPTGDVKGCVRDLETLLRVLKYPGYVDYTGLSKGDPSAFLPIASFALTAFSPAFAEQLMVTGLELTGKNDLRFTDTLYKILRDIFHYKPVLTKQQFLQWGFSQRKISLICDIINLVVQRDKQLKKSRVRYPTSLKNGRGEAPPTQSDADAMSNRPIVVSHTQPTSTVTITSHVKAFSSSLPGNSITEMAGREENKENIFHTSEVEGRLSALEAQIESLQSGLHRLSTLEKRLEELERERNKDKNEGQVITVSRESWENLMSRIHLLETKLELSSTQSSGPPPGVPSTSSFVSSSMCDASKEDINNRLERITNLMKSTSSLLKTSTTSE